MMLLFDVRRQLFHMSNGDIDDKRVSLLAHRRDVFKNVQVTLEYIYILTLC